jgi:hypothetical protein
MASLLRGGLLIQLVYFLAINSKYSLGQIIGLVFYHELDVFVK